MTARRVFYILICLLGMALLTLKVPLFPEWLLLGLGIATLKSILIAYHYMDLKRMSSSMRWLALGSLFWLSLLFILTAADYLTRPYFFL